MQTPYTVPEIARLTGIPETTLYDYVRQFTGIVPEMEPAEENGRSRRRYPEQAIAVFQTIRHLKDRGVDLPTIRALLQEGHPSSDDTVPQDVATIVEESDAPIAATPEQEPLPALTAPEPVAIQPDAAEVEEAVIETPAPAIPDAVADIIISPVFDPGAVVASPFFQPPLVSEPVEVALAATGTTPAETVPTEPVRESLPTPVGTAPETNVLALQTQLLGSLEEGLRTLRDLMRVQDDEAQRLQTELGQRQTELAQRHAELTQRQAELAQEQQENAALRHALDGQKDQTRSAERLLALIKDHCEQGIQTIGA